MAVFADDKSTLNFRLGIDPGGRRRAVRGAVALLLVGPGAAAREVRGDGREQSLAHAAAARAARHAVRSQRAPARREPRRAQHLAGAREPPHARSEHQAARRGDGSPRARHPRHPRTQPPRPRLPARRHHPGRVAGAGVRGARAQARTVRRDRRAGADAPLSERRFRRAPLRLRRRNHGRAAGAARVHRADAGRGGRTGRHRADLQQPADGQGRRARSDRQQPRPRNHEARGTAVH